MFRILGLVLVMLAVFGVTGMANFTTHGEISGTYQNASFYTSTYSIKSTESWLWVVDVSVSPFTRDFFRIGARLECPTSEFVDYQNWLPKAVPEGQYYAIYGEFIVGQFSVRLTDECRHYLSQSSLGTWRNDLWGYSVKFAYTF